MDRCLFCYLVVYSFGLFFFCVLLLVFLLIYVSSISMDYSLSILKKHIKEVQHEIQSV